MKDFYKEYPLGGIHKPTLTIGKYTLKIVVDMHLDNLANGFKNDRELAEYILNNTEEAFYSSVNKYDENKYYLSVASTDRDFYGDPGMSWKRRKVEMYVPIIKKFMIDALTDNLYTFEDGELVKQ